MTDPRLEGHARHLIEIPLDNGMRLTVVREDDHDAVTVWSEDGESIFTRADVAHVPNIHALSPETPRG